MWQSGVSRGLTKDILGDLASCILSSEGSCYVVRRHVVGLQFYSLLILVLYPETIIAGLYNLL